MSQQRVLIVDGSSSFGGATTTLPGLVERLEIGGMQVRLAASHDDGWDRVGLADRIDRMPGSFTAVTGLPYALRELQRAAVLRSLVARDGVDVIVANNDPAVNASAYLAARATGVPVVQLIRGHARHSVLNAVALSAAAAVFSHGGPDEGRRHGFSDTIIRKWRRLDEGLSPSSWPTRRLAGPHRWLWASTLARWKGLSLFHEALTLLEARHVDVPPVDVCFIRLAPGHSDADALPSRWSRGVTLHEQPPHLDTLRAHAAVYVHTSTVPEPFGRSILEAMAAGLCPVVPDEGGAARLVEHGVTGLVYPARSVSGLAAALAVAVAEPALVEACGARAAVSARRFRTDDVLAPLVSTISTAAMTQRPPPDRGDHGRHPLMDPDAMATD